MLNVFKIVPIIKSNIITLDIRNESTRSEITEKIYACKQWTLNKGKYITVKNLNLKIFQKYLN